ncbi:MAG: hypothetical protein HFH87_09220 [Lachnospiraceae bacterium]|nr:hypothetical protein [Lachnospiraceae bacterium]
MEKLSERDELYNAVLETIQKHSNGMEIGLVRAVLAEVDGEICRKVNKNSFDIVCGRLKERGPRECL